MVARPAATPIRGLGTTSVAGDINKQGREQFQTENEQYIRVGWWSENIIRHREGWHRAESSTMVDMKVPLIEGQDWKVVLSLSLSSHGCPGRIPLLMRIYTLAGWRVPRGSPSSQNKCLALEFEEILSIECRWLMWHINDTVIDVGVWQSYPARSNCDDNEGSHSGEKHPNNCCSRQR